MAHLNTEIVERAAGTKIWKLMGVLVEIRGEASEAECRDEAERQGLRGSKPMVAAKNFCSDKGSQ